MITKTAGKFIKLAVDGAELSKILKSNPEFKRSYIEFMQKNPNFSEEDLLGLMDKHKINTSKFRGSQRGYAGAGAGNYDNAHVYKALHKLEKAAPAITLGAAAAGAASPFVLDPKVRNSGRLKDKNYTESVIGGSASGGTLGSIGTLGLLAGSAALKSKRGRVGSYIGAASAPILGGLVGGRIGHSIAPKPRKSRKEEADTSTMSKAASVTHKYLSQG